MQLKLSSVWELARSPEPRRRQQHISSPPTPPIQRKHHSHYRLVPDAIILEFPNELREFNETTSQMRVCEFELDEVLSEITLFISDINFIEIGIEDLANQFRIIHGRDNDEGDEDLVADGEIISQAVVILARALVTKFKELQLYMADGNLPFSYKEFLVTDETLVFAKMLDYKSQIEKEDNEYNPNRWYESRIPDSDFGYVGE